MILFKELNLPRVPPELIVFKNQPDKVVRDIGYNLEHIKEGRTLGPCSYFNTVCDNQPTLEWMQANIPGITNNHKVLKQVSKPLGSEGAHVVHSDVNRVFALNYFLDLGGTDVVTSWYHEHGFPLHRRKLVGGQQSDTGRINFSDLTKLGSTKFKARTWSLLATDILRKLVGGQQSDTGRVKYSDLTKLGSTKFKAHTWYLLATDILHDVDYITSSRVSITISLLDRNILKDLGIEDV